MWPDQDLSDWRNYNFFFFSISVLVAHHNRVYAISCTYGSTLSMVMCGVYPHQILMTIQEEASTILRTSVPDWKQRKTNGNIWPWHKYILWC